MQTYGHIPSNSLFDVKIVTDTDVFFLQLFMLSLGVVKSSNYFFWKKPLLWFCYRKRGSRFLWRPWKNCDVKFETISLQTHFLVVSANMLKFQWLIYVIHILVPVFLGIHVHASRSRCQECILALIGLSITPWVLLVLPPYPPAPIIQQT